MVSVDEVVSLGWPFMPPVLLIRLLSFMLPEWPMLLEWVMLPVRVELLLVELRPFMPDCPEFSVELPVVDAFALVPLACP